MATLILGTVGSLIAGPFGAAAGSLLGRQIDAEIFAPPPREGPRLEDLSISMSSYGHTLARQYGTVRTAGSIIWATDLVEHSETSGGKGKPKTTTYTYSISLAVALSSRPIVGVGRIWADGNLLRGAAGDLKTGGAIRIYTGHADQQVDPLLAADLGQHCSAHRGIAYVVFEDLQLADFGNRIPAMTFEVIAGSGAALAPDLANLAEASAPADLVPDGLTGFSYSRGLIRQVFDLLGNAVRSSCDPASDPLALVAGTAASAQPAPLPEPVVWQDGDFGAASGARRGAAGNATDESVAVRYYDSSRDYQPGLQRSAGRAGHGAERTVEFPGVFSALEAKRLASTIARQRDFEAQTLSWRITELDQEIAPGSIVSAPGIPGLWRIETWEWREGGIELELRRFASYSAAEATSDPGRAWSPRDRAPGETSLRAFELPWDGSGSPDEARIFAAVFATSGYWPGANLYVSKAGSLTHIGNSGPERPVVGELAEGLLPSSALYLEAQASLRLTLEDPDAALGSTDLVGLAGGANRLLVGDEIVQFLTAEQTSPTEWRLAGLLRGRGGTETVAQQLHPAGSPVTVLDNRLASVPTDAIDPGADQLAAIGLAEEDAVFAAIENPGLTLRPLTPVHPRAGRDTAGNLLLCWTRRARGAWSWRDEVDAPLIEQEERYQVGIGPVETPVMQWDVLEPRLLLDVASLASVSAVNAGAPVWVRQVGSHALSYPLLLATL